MSKQLSLIVLSAIVVLVVIALINGIEFQKIVGAFGLVFVGYCWLNGKGVTQMATETGIKIGSPRKQPFASKSPPSDFAKSDFAKADPDNPPMRERAVFLYKRPRGDGDIKTGGTSWLGGLPALGDVQWPHDKAGLPMHHVMQIDLSDAAPFLNVKGLPMHGSLAVFVSLGEDKQVFETKVCYVTQPRGETALPDAIRPVGNHSLGGQSVQSLDPDARKMLPRWAVDMVQLSLEGDINPEDDGALSEQLSNIRPLGTGMNVSAFSFADHLPNGREPSYWHSAQIFADSLSNTARRAASLAPPDRAPFSGTSKEWADLTHRMDTLAADMGKWAFARDPWEVMLPADLATFKEKFAPFQRVRQPSEMARVYHSMPGRFSFLTELADATLKEMLRGPDDVFGLLPEPIRSATDAEYLTPRMPHQMFGPPAWIQDGPAFHEPDHLLLQIVHDSVIGLELAAGHIQVWISPDDLAARNWDGITSVFECT